jgi:hypothetical protein
MQTEDQAMSIALSATERTETATRPGDVSLWRLYLLRASYLLIVVGMGSQVWPKLIGHAPVTSLMQGVVRCMLGGLTLLAVLGLRYPLKMLPLLFFEMAWKATWLIVIAYPAWTTHTIDADMADTIQACLVGAIFPIVIPWGYMAANYLTAPGERWR